MLPLLGYQTVSLPGESRVDPLFKRGIENEMLFGEQEAAASTGLLSPGLRALCASLWEHNTRLVLVPRWCTSSTGSNTAHCWVTRGLWAACRSLTRGSLHVSLHFCDWSWCCALNYKEITVPSQLRRRF